MQKKFFSVDRNCKTFLKQNGYCHISSQSVEFRNLMSDIFYYYNVKEMKGQTAFKNENGVPRHIINILRDTSSPANQIIESTYIIKLINAIFSDDHIKFFTHSKLSLKKKDQFADWFPHQDNGYRSKDRVKDRESYAICLPLEKMTKENGAIEIYPGSNQLGLLKHNVHIENKELMESQKIIDDSNITIKPEVLEAELGDIIIFSGNTLHRSGSNSTDTNRLCIIIEVERFINLNLDDYGLPPIFLNQKPSINKLLLLHIMSFFSVHRYWFIIRQSIILRKILLNLLYLKLK